MKNKYMVNAFLAFLSVLFGFVLLEFSAGRLVTIRDVGPPFSTFHPTYGVHLKPSFQALRKTPEFDMKLTTNAFGFRGPSIDVLPMHPILFLGDSYTLGYGVNDGEDFPALVAASVAESALRYPTPVVNAGLGGSGNGRWIKILNELGHELRPQVVVMQVMGNDFRDNAVENLFLLEDARGLVELPISRPSRLRRLQRYLEFLPGVASSNLFGLLRQIRLRKSEKVLSPERISKDTELTLAILKKAITYSKSTGGSIIAILVGLPTDRKILVKNLFEASGASVIEMPSKSIRPELYYKVDQHWNQAGHEEAARRIVELLRRK